MWPYFAFITFLCFSLQVMWLLLCQVTEYCVNFITTWQSVHFIYFNVLCSHASQLTAMSFMEPPSCQQLLQPYQNLLNFRIKLQICRHQLTLLSAEVPCFLPTAAQWIAKANESLDHITLELQRMEYQILTILQLQLHYNVDQHGHLPHLEADWRCPDFVDGLARPFGRDAGET